MFLFYVNPILIAAAVIPAIVLLRFVYKEDRLDKESPGLLLSLVIFGILSTFAAIVTEQIGEAILGILLPQSSPAYNVLLYVVVVALSEEGFKPAAQEAHVVFKRIQLPVRRRGLRRVRRARLCPVGEYQLCADVRPRHGGHPRRHGRAGARVLRRVHGRVLGPCQALRQLWR